ncbi:MAG: O-antigen ligase family protein [Thermoguttaceae bacterium]|nr:O-antigen ligase family protein [Thermoguttaceae bacterium]
MISYNRANQLAVALSFLCVVVKLLRRERMKAVAICVLLLSLAVAFFGSSLGESFLVRWNEVRDDQGSGRATLILASWNHFLNPESLRHFLIGSGHYSMKELMYEACGARIGAHSDLFDFLTVYGFCGVVIYFAVCFRLLFTGRDRLTRDSLEDIVLRSSTVFVLLVGLFTGVFQATYTLFMLITLQRYLIERGLVGEERAPIAIWSTSTRSFRETLALNEERFEDDLAKESDKNSGSDSLAIFEEAIATFDFEEIEESEKKVRQQRIEAIDDFWKRTQGGDQ